MKYALCIGINYVGSPHELRGCWNDSQRMSKHLNRSGYQVTTLMDKPENPQQPTRDNILRELVRLTRLAQKRKGIKQQTSIVIHYAGHGSHTKDRSGDESDNKDELICTSDNKGILDDELIHFAQSLPEGVRCLCVFDCCHSGTIMDLKWRIRGKRNIVERKGEPCKAKVVCISGCMDNQTSADAWMGKKFEGAMTNSFFSSWRKERSVREVVGYMRKILKLRRFSQVPQITCSDPEVVDLRHFLDNLF